MKLRTLLFLPFVACGFDSLPGTNDPDAGGEDASADAGTGETNTTGDANTKADVGTEGASPNDPPSWPMPGEIPDTSNYEKVGGHVRDKVTGIDWFLAPSGDLDFQAAEALCKTQTVDGLSWTIASREEITSLIDYSIADLPAVIAGTAPAFWARGAVSGSSTSSRHWQYRGGIHFIPKFELARALCVHLPPKKAYAQRFDNLGGYYRDARLGLDWIILNDAGLAGGYDSFSTACPSRKVSSRVGGAFRLPTVKELATLLDDAKDPPPRTVAPSIIRVFDGPYMSGTLTGTSPWWVFFDNGMINKGNTGSRAVCVGSAT